MAIHAPITGAPICAPSNILPFKRPEAAHTESRLQFLADRIAMLAAQLADVRPDQHEIKRVACSAIIRTHLDAYDKLLDDTRKQGEA